MFCSERQHKGCGSRTDVAENLQSDFIESPPLNEKSSILTRDLDQISNKDKKFLQLMDKEVDREDKNYKLPLPFKDQDMLLSNTRIAMEKRLMPFKRRF